MSSKRERIQPLIDDPAITEIMINSPCEVYVERDGRIVQSSLAFSSSAEVSALAEEILAESGITPSSRPYADCRLADGSRVNIVKPAVAAGRTVITIRKFKRELNSGAALVEHGFMNQALCTFFEYCVQARRNIVICGGTGTGKTTLLNVLGNYIPDGDRIITIEDTAEICLSKRHVVRLESRADQIQPVPDTVTIRQLLCNALRMRPDRIIVGECRGNEAFDMLQAMNTGHNGSMTSVHANAPRDCLKRIETMSLMAGFDMPILAIREQIASALHLVVQVSRGMNGERRVSAVDEISGMEGATITLSPVFEWRGGALAPTGIIPSFIQDLHAAGHEIDLRIFQ